MKMRNQVRTIVLLGVLSTLLIGAGGMLGGGWLVGAFVLAVVMNLGAWFFSDSIVLRSTGAREVSEAEAPRLHALVADLARRAELPKPKVCIVPSAEPNAFATGRTPERGVVAVTDGILSLLSERELRGVLAHELAHIKNRDTLVASIAATMAGAVTSVANVAQWAALFGGGSSSSEGEEGQEGSGAGGGGLLLAFLAPVAATLVQLGISRQREYQADASGARICGDPEALASALGKLEAATLRRAEHHEEGEAEEGAAAPRPAAAALGIVNPAIGGGIGRWFSTHPPVEERIRRLLALEPGDRTLRAAA